MEKPPPPPRKPSASSDSFPAVSPLHEEKLWKVLKQLEEELTEINKARGRDLQRILEVEERVDHYAEVLRELQESTLAAKRAAFNVEAMSAKVERLDVTMTKALEALAEGSQKSLMRTVASAREEASQNLRIIEIEAKLRETGNAAGKKAGLTWGGGAAVIGTILGAIFHYLIQAATGH